MSNTTELRPGETVIDREADELDEAIVVETPGEEARQQINDENHESVVTVMFKRDVEEWAEQHDPKPSELVAAAFRRDISGYNYPPSRLERTGEK